MQTRPGVMPGRAFLCAQTKILLRSPAAGFLYQLVVVRIVMDVAVTADIAVGRAGIRRRRDIAIVIGLLALAIIFTGLGTAVGAVVGLADRIADQRAAHTTQHRTTDGVRGK